MPSDSALKRPHGDLRAPEDPLDPPSPAQRKSGSDEAAIAVQDTATNTPSRIDERPNTPVNKPTLGSPSRPTSPSDPSAPTHPSNPIKPTEATEATEANEANEATVATDSTHPTTPTPDPTTPHNHISPTAPLSSPSPLRRTPATPSTGRVTLSSSAISDLNAAPSLTPEVAHLTPSRSTGETLSQQSPFVLGAASPAPATSANTRAAAKSQPNAIGRSHAKTARQAFPTTSAATQRDSSGTQPRFAFAFGAAQQPPQDTTPIAPALAVNRGNCLAISVPRDTTPFEISLAISKCDERLSFLIRPLKDPKGRMLLQVNSEENAQDILIQLQALPLNVRGVKPQIHACYNTQTPNKLLQEGLLENFEHADGVEEEFRKQVEASGDSVIIFQRQFHPRLPGVPTDRVRVLLDISGSKTMPRANAFSQQLPDWVNRYVIFKPVQAGSATSLM